MESLCLDCPFSATIETAQKRTLSFYLFMFDGICLHLLYTVYETFLDFIVVVFSFYFFSWKQTMTFRCLLACKKCSTVNVRGVYFNYKDLLSGTQTAYSFPYFLLRRKLDYCISRVRNGVLHSDQLLFFKQEA